ncbi:unnamed protein product [Caenorhabditis nigoni]
MALLPGKMFILVQVEDEEKVGDLTQKLAVATDYKVPISIVKDIQKICPNCVYLTKNSRTEMVSTTSNSGSDDDEKHPTLLHDTRSTAKVTYQAPQKTNLALASHHHQQPQPQQQKTIVQQRTMPQTPRTGPIPLKVVLAPPAQSRSSANQRISVVPLPIKSQNAPLPRMANGLQGLVPTSKMPMSNGHSTSSTSAIKREPPRSSFPDVGTPQKKIKVADPAPVLQKIIKEESPETPMEVNLEKIIGEVAAAATDDDDKKKSSEALVALLAQWSNPAGCDLPLNGSSSDDNDNASSSSKIFEDDDMPPFNPDILTNLLASQQANDLFGHTSKDNKSETASPGKRQVPPMLTVNGKTRRGRIVYTAHELNVLEDYYEKDPNACADPKKRDTMCKTLSIDYHRLKVWFQNRRRKDKVRSLEDPSNSSNGHSPEAISL